ncbi:MAG: PHP domain-containing protein [Ruminococcaceae bacterium]|nr:PHP domain-containing protein [Oscillospiraceae bacterium]
MNKYYYDLHIHSCLSPCGDDDMTPANICGMAALKGLQIVALTDHNTCGNCESFMKAASTNGLIGIAGMELTTSEDIHIVCLFEFLEDALAFSEKMKEYRTPFPNRVDIFGRQLYLDEKDEVLGEEENFLPIATTLSLESAYELALEYKALVYPAHIDRSANGIVETLGTLPDKPDFVCVEYKDSAMEDELIKKIPSLAGKKRVVNSDAHYLWDINEAENYIELDDEPYSSAYVRHQLFEYLRGGKG